MTPVELEQEAKIKEDVKKGRKVKEEMKRPEKEKI